MIGDIELFPKNLRLLLEVVATFNQTLHQSAATKSTSLILLFLFQEGYDIIFTTGQLVIPRKVATLQHHRTFRRLQ